jgi:4-amino-4-deoxy-L-arabinose transferase-like glycosyltransferase
MRKLFQKYDGWLVCIVLLAAALRWFKPGLWGTWVDELSTLASATDLVHHGRMIWLGNPSTYSGLAAHSPFSIYVSALPFLLSPDPVFARVFYGLLGILTVCLTYLMTKRYYGQTAAVFAGFMIAVAPIPVFWSRYVWNPNIAPLFIILWIWAGLYGYHEGNRKAQFFHWLCLSLMIQSQTALAFMIPLSLFLFVRWLWLNPATRTPALLTAVNSGVLCVLLTIPWIIGLVGVERGWWQVPIGTGNTVEAGIRYNLPAINRIFDNFALLTSNYSFRIGMLNVVDDKASWWPQPSINVILAAQAVLIFMGTVGIVYFSRMRKERITYLYLVLVVIWSLCFLFLDQTRTIPYFYMQPVVIVAPIIFGIVMKWLWERQRLATVIGVGFITAQLWLTLAIIDWYQLGDNAMSISEVQAMLTDWQEIGNEIVFIEKAPADEANLASTEWELFWKILDRQFPLATVYDIHALPIAPDGEILASVASVDVIPPFFGEGEVIDLGKRAFRYVHISPDDIPLLDFVPQDAAMFEDVLRINGVIGTRPSASELWSIIIVWQPINPDNVQYQFSVRLVDTAGNGYGQVDGAALQTNLWRNGDTVITQFNMQVIDTLPDDADLRLNIITYTLPEVRNLSVLDAAGNPVGDTLPLVPVE